MKKLLAVVAGSAPYTPNLSKTGTDLYITDARTLLNYLNLLDQSAVFRLCTISGIPVFYTPLSVFIFLFYT